MKYLYILFGSLIFIFLVGYLYYRIVKSANNKINVINKECNENIMKEMLEMVK